MVDRARRFALPGIDQLNKDQDEALALPLEGQHLVVGGPGTGKSVVALLRARRLATHKKKYRVLVYNHLLNGSNTHLFGMKEPLESKTWDRWFRDMYKHVYGEPVPTFDPEGRSDYRALDWETIESRVEIREGHKPPFTDRQFFTGR